MVDVDLGGLLQDSSIGVYCWGYLLLGKLGVGSSILKIILLVQVNVDGFARCHEEWLSQSHKACTM